MPHSLSVAYLHLIFSTKNRQPFLRDKTTREALHEYIGGISNGRDCPIVRVGGVEDHVHILSRFGRMISQSEWVKEIKRSSSLWIKKQGSEYSLFQWQEVYAIFSVSQSRIASIRNYIEHQEEHHRQQQYQDELRSLYVHHQEEVDEREMWE